MTEHDETPHVEARAGLASAAGAVPQHPVPVPEPEPEPDDGNGG